MNYEQKLALLSLVQLNTVLVQQGLVPLDDKRSARDAVRRLIDNGSVEWDSVLNVQPQTIITGKTAIDDDLRDKVNTSNAKALDAVKNSEIALREISRISGDVRSSTAAIRDEFKTLAESLVSRVDSITKPDPARVSNEITQQVNALFDSFREQVTPQQIKQVANALPSFELIPARDVFGADACRYDGVDFGDLPVAVWNDPEAPALVDDYIFNPAHLHQSLIALDDPLPDNVWLAGERGTGKSEFVTQVAARLRRRLFRINFDEALERADFIGGNSIVMTAATAYDPSGVDYYFTCTAGSGHDSGWQSSATYTDTGLTPGSFSYTVKTRDRSPAQNPSTPSAAASATISATPTVPDVVGMMQTAAQQILTAAGHAPGTVQSGYSATVPHGSIISQSPAGEQTAAWGSSDAGGTATAAGAATFASARRHRPCRYDSPPR